MKLARAVTLLGILALSSPATARTVAQADLDQNAFKLYGLPLVPDRASGAVPLQFVTPGAGYLKSSGLNGTVSASPTIPYADISGAPAAITATTGDVVATGPGSVPATIQPNVVGNTKFRQAGSLSVVGNATNATANVADIQASGANQVLVTNSAGTAVTWAAAIPGSSVTLPAGAVGYGSASNTLTGDAPNFFWNSSSLRLGLRAGGAPAYQLHVVDEVVASDRGIELGEHAASAVGQRVVFRKSRGTFASPAAGIASDYGGRIQWENYDGTNWIPTFATGVRWSVPTAGVAGGNWFVAAASAGLDEDPFTANTRKLTISAANGSTTFTPAGTNTTTTIRDQAIDLISTGAGPVLIDVQNRSTGTGAHAEFVLGTSTGSVFAAPSALFRLYGTGYTPATAFDTAGSIAIIHLTQNSGQNTNFLEQEGDWVFASDTLKSNFLVERFTVKNDGSTRWPNGTAAVSGGSAANIRAFTNKLQYSQNGGAWVNFDDIGSGTFVPLTRTLTAGAGLVGLGTLAADRTVDVAAGDATIVVHADDIVAGVMQTANIAAHAVTLPKIVSFITDSFPCRDTAGTGDLEVCAVGGGIEFTGGPGIQRSAFAGGDVSGPAGSAVLTIVADAVTNAKAANMTAPAFKGRTTAGTGDPEDLTATQATAMLNVFSSTLKGLAPASGGGTVNFLRADGAYAVPPGTGVTSVSGTIGRISSTLGTTPILDLVATAVTPGSYTATNLTVDAYGRITAASNGSSGGGGTVTSMSALPPLFVTLPTTTPQIEIRGSITTGGTSTSATSLGALGAGVLEQTVSGGVSTPAAYATTVNRILLGTSAGGVTDSNLVTWDGTRAAFGTTSPASATVGQFTRNVNGQADLMVQNTSAGTGAQAALRLTNGSGGSTDSLLFALFGAGVPTSGVISANSMLLELETGGDFVSNVYGAGDYVWATTTSRTQRMKLTNGGLFGVGTSPLYRLDVAQSAGSQIHFSSGGADSGGYLISTAADQGILSGGSQYNGTNWIAKTSVASIVSLNSGQVAIAADAGLTASVAYAPTTRLTVSPSGVDVPSLSAGGMTKSAVTTGRLQVATANVDYQPPVTWPAPGRFIVAPGTFGGAAQVGGNPTSGFHLQYDFVNDLVAAEDDASFAAYAVGGTGVANSSYLHMFGNSGLNTVNVVSESRGATGVPDLHVSAGTAALHMNGLNTYVDNLTTNGYVQTGGGSGHLGVITGPPSAAYKWSVWASNSGQGFRQNYEDILTPADTGMLNTVGDFVIITAPGGSVGNNLAAKYGSATTPGFHTAASDWTACNWSVDIPYYVATGTGSASVRVSLFKTANPTSPASYAEIGVLAFSAGATAGGSTGGSGTCSVGVANGDKFFVAFYRTDANSAITVSPVDLRVNVEFYK